MPSSSHSSASWLSSSSSVSTREHDDESDFSCSNFPFGVFSLIDDDRCRCGSRLGNWVIDLSVLEDAGSFDDILNINHHNQQRVFDQSTLNYFLSEYTKPVWIQIRNRMIDLFVVKDGNHNTADPRLQNNLALQKATLIPADYVKMHLPVDIGDYTDFYASREHATNCGIIFRGSIETALPTNWLHLPIGYHGRSSTVFVSPTQVPRPCGQIQQTNDPTSSLYGPCQKLDFELEVGAIVGGPTNPQGHALTIEEAKQRIFGFVLLNDWSARDIQKWEYVPLGPFTAKNFATTISPWIVMVEALTIAPTSAKIQNNPIPLPYLQDPNYASYDVELTVDLQTSSSSSSSSTRICTSNFRNVYWNTVQQLVHHTVTGCIMRPGDLLGSGTISGSQPNSFGSLLELSWNGTKPIVVNDHGDETRTFLQDGDTVILKGVCYDPSNGDRVGFGSCQGTILPATPLLSTQSSATEASVTTKNIEVKPPPTKMTQSIHSRYQNFCLYDGDSTTTTSSLTRSMRIALTAKHVSYKMIPYSMELPIGLPVPLLECTDTRTGTTILFTQLLAAIRFLERAFPNTKSLFFNHKDVVDEAVELEIVEIINSLTLQITTLQNHLEPLSEATYSKQPKEGTSSVVETGLRAVEQIVQQQHNKYHGPFCMGNFSPTVADIYLVPLVHDARHRYHVPVDSMCPTLVQVAASCQTHAWFVQSDTDDMETTKSEST